MADAKQAGGPGPRTAPESATDPALGAPVRPAVMTDVARVAGVSHQTVSRVLHNHPRVAAAPRARVQAAMAELEYRPNTAARALVTRRSQTLGVVSFSSTLHGPTSTLFGVEQAARAAGYFTSIVSLKQIDVPAVGDAFDHLLDQGVEGIIVIAPQLHSAKALVQRHRPVPLVAVEAGPEEIPTVAVDQRVGAGLATDHLLSLGHDTVWHIAGPKDWIEAEARVAGWRSALERAGREVPPLLTGDWSAGSGYEAGGILARTRGLTAVFAANDHMALGVLRAFHEHGVSVPDDVAIVGYDDIPEAAYFTPPLTTVRQDFDELGRMAIDLLLELIGSGQPGVVEHRSIRPSLVVRESAR
jgi:DNA-binding LacI/PurR family transcriptional regulator